MLDLQIVTDSAGKWFTDQNLDIVYDATCA